MLTHKIIQSEIEELKQILVHNDLEIPSFWRCIWPGLVCMLWFLLSSYFSYGISDFSSGLDRLGAMVFAGAMGVFSTIAIANTRSLFLSLPEGFRRESAFFRCLSKKCKAYGLTILFLFAFFAFVTSSIGWNVVAFCVLTIFSIVITVMVMNFDIGRYQLSTLTSVIESVRRKDVKSSQ